jgi:molybdopterin converting factor small subunit
MLEIRLSGHLAFYAPQKKSRFSVPMIEPTELAMVLHNLGVPLGEIALASVNGEMVDPSMARVKPGDTVELFPPMGGG